MFARLDPAAALAASAPEGEWRDGGEVATVEGPAASLLAGERTALNLLGRLSGVATLTARYVEAVEGTGARILDTRKTTPGLRELEKRAVVTGGGVSHRMGLYDAVLIKENHAALAGGVAAATRAALAGAPGGDGGGGRVPRPRRGPRGAGRRRGADPARQHGAGARCARRWRSPPAGPSWRPRAG